MLKILPGVYRGIRVMTAVCATIIFQTLGNLTPHTQDPHKSKPSGKEFVVDDKVSNLKYAFEKSFFNVKLLLMFSL